MKEICINFREKWLSRLPREHENYHKTVCRRICVHKIQLITANSSLNCQKSTCAAFNSEARSRCTLPMPVQLACITDWKQIVEKSQTSNWPRFDVSLGVERRLSHCACVKLEARSRCQHMTAQGPCMEIAADEPFNGASLSEDPKNRFHSSKHLIMVLRNAIENFATANALFLPTPRRQRRNNVSSFSTIDGSRLETAATAS